MNDATMNEQGRKRVRVVVADDHPLYREGIVRALLAHGGFDVVAETADGAEALRLIRELEPDLALLDVRMPGLDGVDVVHALALHGPDVPVVMLSAFTESQLVESALEAGAAGYLDKGEDRDLLCERLAAIASRRVDLAPRRLSPHELIGRNGQWVPRLTGSERLFYYFFRFENGRVSWTGFTRFFRIDLAYLEKSCKSCLKLCPSSDVSAAASSTMNRVYFPSSLSTLIVPPKSRMIPKLILRPNPVPPVSRRVVKNGSKTLVRSSRLIPTPLS